jgi:hypothetical protein
MRVTEGMPLPAGSDEHGAGGCFLRLIIPGYQQAAAQHTGRLIECVVRMRDGPGKTSRDGHLHGREPSGPILITRKDVHRLPRIRKGWSISAMNQERHEPSIRPQPGAAAG